MWLIEEIFEWLLYRAGGFLSWLVKRCRTSFKNEMSTEHRVTELIDGDSYVNRGNAYGRKGKYDQAISDYSKALEINPRLTLAYYNRGVIYGKKGQHDKAISNFNEALEINPKFAEAYCNRAVAYSFKREYEKSWEDVEKAQSLGYQIPPKFLDKLRKASGRQK